MKKLIFPFYFFRLDDEAKVTAVEEIHDAFVEDTINECIKEIATQEMLLVHQLNKYMDICPQIAEDLINELLNELVEPQLQGEKKRMVMIAN